MNKLGQSCGPPHWPRWLLLERAFQDGSEKGGLHFAAVTLRAICEEVERRRLLDKQTPLSSTACHARSKASVNFFTWSASIYSTGRHPMAEPSIAPMCRAASITSSLGYQG